ncbi:MAG TPA: RluA family pseudouridine synthase [Verrucomicrobiae bacterium]|nr:RluA family pseudouridine synthase [Verrucomicrobiae bacterium]
MRSGLFPIVHEDGQLLVINKPAGLVCHPTKQGEYSSLVGRIRLHLGECAVFHLINRLDRETSGLVVVGKDNGCARALRQLWERREAAKRYMAIVHGSVMPEEFEINAPLGKDTASKVAIKDCARPDGAAALTRCRLMKRFRKGICGSEGTAAESHEFSLLEVCPATGRKHQIRIHLAHFGHPIVGDKLYGGDEDCYLALVEDRLSPEQKRQLILPFHALHAFSLSFVLNGEQRSFHCEPEAWFSEFLE